MSSMTTDNLTRIDTQRLLGEFGVDLGPVGMVVLSDMPKAETCYIHHSRMPVALVAFALASPTFARGRFVKTRLVDLITKRPSMDGPEAIALGAVCGVDVSADMWPRSPAPAFREQLQRVIYRHGLDALFSRNPRRPACNEIDWRPRGIDLQTDEIIATEMQAWRRNFRALPRDRQMMAATVLWLYCGGEPAKVWMRGLPSWHAADAVDTLRAAGRLRDWGKLVALYPGW